jgi:hypothetical protein
MISEENGSNIEREPRILSQEDREKLIDSLDKSFKAMPTWVKSSVKHALRAPKNNPETGLPFKTFREVITISSDQTLLTLKEEFIDNDDFIE